MNNWEYKGIYQNYNMSGIIKLPNYSKLKVCDLTVEMPNFMKEADTLFIDPPCSEGNLKTFYTKSNKMCNIDFSNFYEYLFRRIDEINPDHLFLEVFKSNKDLFIAECQCRYTTVSVHENFYYKNKSNRCWIIQCNNQDVAYNQINGIDEEQAIKWICENHLYNCIGDLCMGTGLVGKYAFDNKKQFVGTELNEKRLALLIHYINTGKFNKN
jgi:hypothetical protein